MQLYEKYGGVAAVSQNVPAFFDKVLASPSLDPHFASGEMEALIDHQTKFLCKVLGGPDNYAGRAMRTVHRHRNITAQAFNQVARLLKDSLEEAQVEPADVTTIMGIVASVRGDVVAAPR